jgi:hypothetical protein
VGAGRDASCVSRVQVIVTLISDAALKSRSSTIAIGVGRLNVIQARFVWWDAATALELRSQSSILAQHDRSLVLALDQERVALAFFADRRKFAVAGDDYCFIRQREDCVVQRAQDFLHAAAGQIGAAD